MLFELPNISIEESRKILKYFVAQYKAKNNSFFLGNSSAQFIEDNLYQIIIEDSAVSNINEKCSIFWKLTVKENEQLKSIEVLDDKGQSAKYCSDFLNKIYQKILLNALVKKEDLFFKRNYFFYKHPTNLSGEYWLDSRTRIGPLYTNDNVNHLDPIERVLVVDQEIFAIDSDDASDLSYIDSSEIISQLSILLNIGFYRGSFDHRYAILKNAKGEYENPRIQLGIIDKNRPNQLPKKGELCGLDRPKYSFTKHDHYFSEALHFPKETRKIINHFKSSSPLTKNSFYNCCKMFEIGLNLDQNLPSAKISYYVGAINSLFPINKSESEFRAFMKKYQPNIEDNSLDFIYGKVRSSHWHFGTSVFEENKSKNSYQILNPNSQLSFFRIRYSEQILRNALCNWILNQLDQK